MISVANGSLRANSARSCARVTGRRITKVPAAPMLTLSRCFSCSASVVGRKVLWSPTLIPLRRTTSATSLLPLASASGQGKRRIFIHHQQYVRLDAEPPPECPDAELVQSLRIVAREQDDE